MKQFSQGRWGLQRGRAISLSLVALAWFTQACGGEESSADAGAGGGTTTSSGTTTGAATTGSDGGGGTTDGVGAPIDPVQPRSVALYDYNICEIQEGKVLCEGLSDSLLGTGAPDECRMTAIPVDLGKGTVISVTLGRDHACALFSDGGVKCWGQNDKGQLGLGDTNDRGDEPKEMGEDLPRVLLQEPALQVEAKGNTTCALLASHQVKCWGDVSGADVDVGIGPTDLLLLAPLSFPEASGRVERMSIGVFSSCFLMESGEVICQGSKWNGQLLAGDLPNGAANLGAGKVIDLASADDTHCAVFETGQVKCWGNNTDCVAGFAASGSPVGEEAAQRGEALPVLDLGEGFIAQEVVGAVAHFCALSTSGEVRCWGDNWNDQLGYSGNDFGEMCAPQLNGDPAPAWEAAGRKVEVAAGGDGTCVRMESGALDCTHRIGCIL